MFLYSLLITSQTRVLKQAFHNLGGHIGLLCVLERGKGEPGGFHLVAICNFTVDFSQSDTFMIHLSAFFFWSNAKPGTL